jgi:hypothetical protein
MLKVSVNQVAVGHSEMALSSFVARLITEGAAYTAISVSPSRLDWESNSL